MLTRIEVRNFRNLRDVKVNLSPFMVLVGPNGSGKSSLLDALEFVGDLIRDGLTEAVAKRTENIMDLFWNREGDSFEIAIEAKVPEEIRQKIPETVPRERIRYAVRIAYHEGDNTLRVDDEHVLLLEGQFARDHASISELGVLWPYCGEFFGPGSIPIPHYWVLLWRRRIADSDPGRPEIDGQRIQRETDPKSAFSEENLAPAVRSDRSSLSDIGIIERYLPATTWFRDLLLNHSARFDLAGTALKGASLRSKGASLTPDGNGLPWVIERFQRDHPKRAREWIEHVRLALPDLRGVRVGDMPDLGKKYLMFQHESGVDVPSWMMSDGSLRVIALTLFAYLPKWEGLLLIEEPENGVHPRNLEVIMQSLKSMYDAQVLVTSHSPLLLSLVEPAQMLCFTRARDGSATVVRGDEHPSLREWERSWDLGLLHASGTLE